MAANPSNPFLFGKPVCGEHFCDRHDELQRLVASGRYRFVDPAFELWLRRGLRRR